MESHIKVQQDLYQRILRARNNFKKSPKDRLSSANYITTRLEALEELWAQFSLTHSQIIQDSDSKALNSSSYVKNEIYEITEELHIDCKFEMKEALTKLKCENVNRQDSVADKKCVKEQSIKLPKISIPVFSGKYSEWTSFKDLFTSLVHKNTSLDNVQKLHYLKGHLIGEAEQLLRHVQITEDNYVTCWNQLEKRYDNKKYLSNCILKRFMSQKNIISESAGALKELLDTMNECLYALKNLGIDISTWDIIVIYIVALKLDSESRKQWELKVSESSDNLPTLQQFREFLETRYRALEFIDPNKLSRNNYVPKYNNVAPNCSPKVHHVTAFKCVCCSENHRLCNCKQFSKMETDTRRKFVQSSNLCYNCLNAGHSVYTCRQSSRCRICNRKHHSLLHPKSSAISTESNCIPNHSVDQNVVAHATQSSSQEETSNITSCFSTTQGQVLLATALVNAESKTGKLVTLRCLIDQGSQATFISNSAVQLLGLKRIPHKSTISGLGSDESVSLTSKSMITVRLHSLHEPRYVFSVQAFVLNKLTSILPEQKVVIEWSQFSDLNLADPTFHTPNRIDILLGADVYGQILLSGIVKGLPGTPLAQNTKLGWILSGSIRSDKTNLERRTIVSMHHTHINENELLKKFWELEADNFVDSKPYLTDDEKKCEDIFVATTKRDSSGRYIVSLPFRDDDPGCKYGNSRDIATKRFLQLEKRLIKDPGLKRQYSDVIAEYVEIGHMEVISDDQKNRSDVVYLPHHGVVREDKTTTKLRVVFDASCIGTNGVSLNQDLLVGPTLQPDLRHIIMRWRCYPVCLVSDIVKMYRQIKVDEKDTDFQRLLWRENPEAELQHLKMLRVTFGVSSAPYLAVRSLQQLAHDEGKGFPMAAERVLKHFYMDDLLTGCETVTEGLQIYKEMNELLEKGGFKLQKWCSNQDDLLKEMSDDRKELEGNLQLKIDSVMKILGLTWNRNNDEFEYSVQLPPLRIPVTKRSVISDISRLFDPLGWLAPVIILAKVFIQKLWLSGIDWDDELPPQLLKDWLNYRNDLQVLTKFKLPRWIHTRKDDKLQELHGFCDASNDAFAAVVYLRSVDEDDHVHVSLITSKTKVAPIKQISIPRLELCGAVLLTRLLVEVTNILDIEKSKVHAWTDSSVVLAWLNSRPNRWKTFVANRVSEVISSLEPEQWSHVSSKDNPADCASRGTKSLEDEPLWTNGPSWLKEKVISYKRQGIENTNLEEKTKKLCLVNIKENSEDRSIDMEEEIMSRFSALRKLVRVVAFCKRFSKNAKSGKREEVSKWLTSAEIRDSLKICILKCQEKHFSEELKYLKEKGKISKKSRLTSLNPFLDESGLLRVGGRLQHANINENMKHPIILPQKSHFTNLVVTDAHERTLHGGPQLMVNHLRTQFWIVGAKQLVKTHVRKCVICVRHSARMKHQLMGQLPSSRTTACRPFYHSGVDYAGPVNIRTSKGRGQHAYKGYICLFICMATRAIHLEAVSDLTAQGFLAAYKRFVARRGHCADLWSDNGTNFVGAARAFKFLFAEEKSKLAIEIADHLASNGTNWHYIPPHSPNFGGLWEAGVKSTKYHLKRIIGNSTLTFEEMTTVLTQIEACLNSRPLSQINDNPDEPIPLTPGHFLVGEPLILAPDVNYESSNISSLKRWQLVQRMVQDFWRRWSNEYLTQFYHRYKWSHKTPEPQVGNIVLVREDGLPPARWLYGIIIDKHSGLDGITRVVSLRCKDNIIKRPVSKLCFLPITV